MMVNLIRADIASKISRDLNLSPTQSKELVDLLLEQIIQTLIEKGEVKISRFGTFKIRHKTSRPGRNPKTGDEVLVTPRVTVSFKPSTTLKKEIKASISI